MTPPARYIRGGLITLLPLFPGCVAPAIWSVGANPFTSSCSTTCIFFQSEKTPFWGKFVETKEIIFDLEGSPTEANANEMCQWENLLLNLYHLWVETLSALKKSSLVLRAKNSARRIPQMCAEQMKELRKNSALFKTLASSVGSCPQDFSKVHLSIKISGFFFFLSILFLNSFFDQWTIDCSQGSKEVLATGSSWYLYTISFHEITGHS